MFLLPDQANLKSHLVFVAPTLWSGFSLTVKHCSSIQTVWSSELNFYYLGEKQHNFQIKGVLNLQTNKWYDRKFKHKLALLVAFEAKETSE